jgi:hypothetical protein
MGIQYVKLLKKSGIATSDIFLKLIILKLRGLCDIAGFVNFFVLLYKIKGKQFILFSFMGSILIFYFTRTVGHYKHKGSIYFPFCFSNMQKYRNKKYTYKIFQAAFELSFIYHNSNLEYLIKAAVS